MWTFFWDLRTGNSCWRPDLENTVGGKAIQSLIYSSWPSFSLTFLLFSPQFPSSIAPIIHSSARCWLFWVFQGSQWLAYPRIRTHVHLTDCRLDPEVKWWSHVSFMVTYRMKKTFLLQLSRSKERSELLTRYCFLPNVSKRGTHYNGFLMGKLSCKMKWTRSFDIVRMSAISLHFILRFAKIISSISGLVRK